MVTNCSGKRNFMQIMRRAGGGIFFLLGFFLREGRIFGVCSHHVLIMFPRCSHQVLKMLPSSQCVP